MDDDLEDYKLETVFEREAGCVLHTSWVQDRSRGLRKVQVKDRWHRKGEIGVGSFSTVYLEATADGRQRAVKAIRKRLTAKFNIDHKRELAALTVLSRPKIFVEFLGWFEDDDFVFLAMEYIPLGDLSMYEKEVNDDDAKIISQQLLEGLQIMHKKGFTHRDLKPQNIFIVQTTPSWWVKIGDFGISKRITAEDATELRTEAGAMGYEAPEIRGLVNDGKIKESSVYSNAVDIWSLGCVIYKIMTKKVPFPTSGDLRSFCDGRIPFPSQPLEGKMSKEGIEFLKEILEPKLSLRPAAVQALQHNWLKFEETPEEVIFNTAELESSLPNVTTQTLKPTEIIRFNDAVRRRFSFPFTLCKTWAGMEALILQAFEHVEEVGPHVVEGHYYLAGPNRDIILPQVWEMMIQPGWTITMYMRPVPELSKKTSNGKSVARADPNLPSVSNGGTPSPRGRQALAQALGYSAALPVGRASGNDSGSNAPRRSKSGKDGDVNSSGKKIVGGDEGDTATNFLRNDAGSRRKSSKKDEWL